MKRLTISLPDELGEALELLAWTTKDSQSDVVQYALAHYFKFADVKEAIEWARRQKVPATRKPATKRTPK
jgi:predicted transcriptional regulator